MTDNMRASVRHPDKIDLSPTSGRLPLNLRLALAQIFGKVPGVHLEHARVPTPMRDEAEVAVTFLGWSPTLHAIRYDIKADVDADPRDDDYADAVVEAIGPIVARQVQRHRIGMEFGLSTPLPVGKEGTAIELRHLSVDTSLPLMARLSGEDLGWEIQEGLRYMHRTTADDDRDYLLNGSAYGLLCGLGHLVGVNINYDGIPGISMVGDGMSLEIIGRTAPETALAQMVGRPLSDLLSIHPELDQRIVRSAESGEAGKSPRLRITLVPDSVPLAETLAASTPVPKR